MSYLYVLLCIVGCNGSGKKIVAETSNEDTASMMDTGFSDTAEEAIDTADTNDTEEDSSSPINPREEDCAQQRIAVDPGFAEAQHQGISFLYTPMNNPRAIVFLFHGRGGSKEVWQENLENRIVVNELSAKGWMSIANTRDEDRTDEENNAEIETLKNGLSILGISEDTPIYGIGFSGGGAFISQLVHSVDFNAVISYNSRALGFTLDTGSSLPPAMMFASKNDEVIDPNDIIATYEMAEARGVNIQLRLMEDIPVSEGAFHRIPEIDCEISGQFHQMLIDGGILDTQGSQMISPIESDWQSLLPPVAQTYETDIMWVLKVHFATHAFSSRDVEEMITFFEGYQ